jgi:hypothetical protein
VEKACACLIDYSPEDRLFADPQDFDRNSEGEAMAGTHCPGCSEDPQLREMRGSGISCGTKTGIVLHPAMRRKARQAGINCQEENQDRAGGRNPSNDFSLAVPSHKLIVPDKVR